MRKLILLLALAGFTCATPLLTTEVQAKAPSALKTHKHKKHKKHHHKKHKKHGKKHLHKK